MFLSNIHIKNYRSIKKLNLKLFKGKNVIVGKNNAGKSNIIKAINLILGENSPTYAKAENITENDFYNGITDEPIYIFCLLQREDGEKLNYDEIYNCMGFYCHVKNYTYQNKKPIITDYERHKVNFESENIFNDFDALLNIDQDDNVIKKVYINPKFRNQKSFEDELDSCYQFGFIFRASKVNNKIIKDIRFVYRENENIDWRLAFSAPIRNEFIQCAMIPSFRDPNNVLRINQWSWYGKLLRSSIDEEDKGLHDAFEIVKTVSEEIFANLKGSISQTGVKVAFPNTEISFQFNPDTKIDIYKSTLIYVNDGFNSLLEDKGSGIQSAVIIGLFHYYTRNISHKACSLLALEEPELYLHPQARRVISSRIDEFISDSDNENQVILTTHSPEFISTAHDNLNIILAKKSSDSSTTAFNVKLDTSKDKQILVKIQNAEMFFADGVILVEGGEKYILEAFCKYFGRIKYPELGENWLDENNISIISVGGKTEFHKYYKILNEIGVSVYLLSDFDFFLRQFADFITKVELGTELKNSFNGINGKITKPTFEPTETINKAITNLIDEISASGSGYKLSNKDIISRIKEQITIKTLNQVDSKHHEEIKQMREQLKSYKIFFLDGELESIYTEKTINGLRENNIGGKEEKPIYLASRILNNKKILFEDYIDIAQYNLFIEFVATDLRLINTNGGVNQLVQEV